MVSNNHDCKKVHISNIIYRFARDLVKCNLIMQLLNGTQHAGEMYMHINEVRNC